MPSLLRLIAEWCAAIVELLGLAVIVALAVYSLAAGGLQLVKPGERAGAWDDTRKRLARGILLGLELLVAADIIRTVAIDPTLESVGVLAIIVAIRTFLSFTLEMDVTGKWPWQRGAMS